MLIVNTVTSTTTINITINIAITISTNNPIVLFYSFSVGPSKNIYSCNIETFNNHYDHHDRLLLYTNSTHI